MQGKVEVYKSRGQYRWRITAANGRKLANGGEAYKRRVDCLKALNRVLFAAFEWPLTLGK